MRKLKDNKNNTTTTITPSTSDKTPIEIALQIDSDGMTTLSKLYNFLEINPSNYSRWCRKNIINNPFANEGYDYISFRHHEENPSLGGRPKTDYKLTSDFAKQLCMTVRNERGKQARDYFIACEQGLKVATTKLQERNDDIQALAQSVNNLVQKIDSKFDSLEARVSTLENNVTTPKALPKKRYTYWSSKMFAKYQALADYFEISYKELYKNLYRELENRYPDVEVNQIVDDYCYENHLETCYPLDAIEHNRRVRILFEQLVDNLLEKYNLATPKENFVVSTIFDTKN
ncbi:MAG: antA/AntB antirepressor family protein [Lachnospiraceae bacterium]|nr:antA/AntB antirepressor family protein [Lachnospiraceae bacterium]